MSTSACEVVVTDHEFIHDANPRREHLCCRCDRPRGAHEYRRDVELERYLTELAAQAAGFTKVVFDEYGFPENAGDDMGLRAFADGRAHPGGVRATLDVDREAAEELADCGNYLVWGIVPIYPWVLKGETWACDIYERRMRALRGVLIAWRELHTQAA